MARITFKSKLHPVTYAGDSEPDHYSLSVPKLERRHCDMPAFRQHPRYGGVANSDLFPNALAKIKRERLGETVRLDRLPDGVTVDTSGFLATVTLNV